jgi:purine-nucleoside phosphorylase
VSDRLRIEQARRFLSGAAPFAVRTGLVLGSGLGPVREAFKTERAMAYREIPHFPVSTVSGHRGQLVFARRGPHRLAILDGRVHRYEGYGWSQVTFPVRVLAALGVRTMIITNASGSVGDRMKPGDIMVLDDHVDLIWKGIADLSCRPPAVHRPYYSRRLSALALEVALAEGIRARPGVLLGTTGPCYETRAEVDFARGLGADAVTMSTVPEVTVCRQLGVSVLGLSVVTNVAASHQGGHEGVIDFAARAGRDLRTLVVGVLDALSRGEPRRKR